MIYLAIIALAQTGFIAFLLIHVASNAARAAEERATLLQRIQAPQFAVMQHAAARVDLEDVPQVPPWDTDFPESKEELAVRIDGDI